MNIKRILRNFIRESIDDDEQLAAATEEYAQTDEYNSWLMGQPEMKKWRKDFAAYRSPEEKRRDEEIQRYERTLNRLKQYREEDAQRRAEVAKQLQRKKDRDLMNVEFDDDHENYVVEPAKRNRQDGESGDGVNMSDPREFEEIEWDF